MPPDAQPEVSASEILVLEGSHAILELSSVLEDFALRCDQPDSFRMLEHILRSGSRWKRPTLALVFMPNAGSGFLKADQMLGAALFLEYHCMGLSTRMLINQDIIATENLRDWVAGAIAQSMLNYGAHAIYTSYEWSQNIANQPWLHLRTGGVEWSQLSRERRKQISLGITYDETLSRLGKTTRRNLRYYRRRLEAKTSCVYLPDACGAFTEEDAVELNRTSLYSVRDDMCRMQYRSCATSEGFVAAIRGADGIWLSAIGGWRYGSTTIVYWQTNRINYYSHSLVTAMRAYFIESEVERGTTRLIFQSGTAHSMSHSFEEKYVTNYMVRRRSMHTVLLRVVARLHTWFGMSFNDLSGRDNVLIAALANRDLHWNSASIVPAASATSWRRPHGGEDRSTVSSG